MIKNYFQSFGIKILNKNFKNAKFILTSSIKFLNNRILNKIVYSKLILFNDNT